jgi:hypothetical protein
MKTVRAMTERAPWAPAAGPAAATTTTTTPDYSIYDLAAAMASARKVHALTRLQSCKHLELLNPMYLIPRFRRLQETARDGYSARQANEVREIEFFPTRTAANHADDRV